MEWSALGTRLFACSAVMVAVSTLAVALRFISRGRILHVLGPTDWFIAATLVFAIVNTAGVGAHVSRGLGTPSSEISDEERRAALKLQYFLIIVNNLGLILSKISVTLLFLDVFLLTWIRKATYGLLVVVILHGLELTLTNIFVCSPISLYWTNPRHPACGNYILRFIIQSSINVVLNFALLLLPLPLILPLRLPWRQKLWLLVLFCLGFAVCIFSLLRVVFVRADLRGDDYWAAGTRIVLWSIMEINLPIIIACIPTLRPLAAKVWPALAAATPPTNDTSLDRTPRASSAGPVRLRAFDRYPKRSDFRPV
ncbi:hypothetical protein VTI28DRAFT_10552 [Corynascus sepedonium]